MLSPYLEARGLDEDMELRDGGEFDNGDALLLPGTLHEQHGVQLLRLDGTEPSRKKVESIL